MFINIQISLCRDSFQKSISYSTSKIKDHKSLAKQYIFKNALSIQNAIIYAKMQYALSTKVIINYNFVLSRDISKCANYTFVIVCNWWRPPHAITLFLNNFFFLN